MTYIAPNLIFPALEFPAPAPAVQPDEPEHRKDVRDRIEYADTLRTMRTTTPRPAPGQFTVIDLDDDVCHFPLGDRPFLFCGQPTFVSPYCARCARIAYR